MCEGQGGFAPANAGEALAAVRAGLAFLNRIGPAELTAAEQAECLRALEQAAAAQTAARSKILAAFAAQDGPAADGQYSPRAWLRWQTKVTGRAASEAVGWAKRLAAHPGVAEALAGGAVSASWARDICAWSDRLPGAHRGKADAILLAAVAAGADRLDLSRLAEEMYARCAGPGGGSDTHDDRGVYLGTTFRGAGTLSGDLTATCAAALGAVLDALGGKAGPEDSRTLAQRRHDALEEACTRLLGSRMLPGRAGQPTQAVVHLSLAQLRALPGAAEAEQAWITAQAGDAGSLTGPTAAGAACDTSVIPVVTGHVDPQALDRLTGAVLAAHPTPAHSTSLLVPPPGRTAPAAGQAGPTQPTPEQALPPATEARLRRALLALAIDAVSGPTGLASWLRHTTLSPPPTGPPRPGDPLLAASLPLDVGTATPTIPAHLRRAVIARDRHCAFPGCHQPPAACQVHHLHPRAHGGPTALQHLLLLCRFHHLIAVHQWGWQLALHPGATVTATSPDATRTLHTHSPPTQAA